MSLYFYIASYLKVSQKKTLKQGQPHRMQGGKELIYDNDTTQELRKILQTTFFL